MSQALTTAKSQGGGKMHGQIGETVNKKPVFGQMSREQIKVWVLEKLNELAKADKDGKRKKMPREANVGQAVNDFMDGGKKHKDTPYTFQNCKVWHCSAGVEEKSDDTKCSLFFIITDPANGVGKIIGIGHHVTGNSYKLLWKRPGWLVGKTLTLS